MTSQLLLVPFMIKKVLKKDLFLRKTLMKILMGLGLLIRVIKIARMTNWKKLIRSLMRTEDS